MKTYQAETRTPGRHVVTIKLLADSESEFKQILKKNNYACLSSPCIIDPAENQPEYPRTRQAVIAWSGNKGERKYRCEGQIKTIKYSERRTATILTVAE